MKFVSIWHSMANWMHIAHIQADKPTKVKIYGIKLQ